MSPAIKPEDRAREKIDEQLTAAGWTVQSRDEVNLSAARGVAVREFKMAPQHGIADYLLFVDEEPVGALEAKKKGFTLSGVEGQAVKYSEGLPKTLDAPVEPLPFLYLSTGVETQFINLLDPHPRSRRIYNVHRPDTVAEWMQADDRAPGPNPARSRNPNLLWQGAGTIVAARSAQENAAGRVPQLVGEQSGSDHQPREVALRRQAPRPDPDPAVDSGRQFSTGRQRSPVSWCWVAAHHVMCSST